MGTIDTSLYPGLLPNSSEISLADAVDAATNPKTWNFLSNAPYSKFAVDDNTATKQPYREE